MPQTIAMQRGTTTVAADNSTSVTLFTQSGGTATRVIVNQVGFYFSATPTTGTVHAVVLHNVSGGQSTMLGILRDPDRRRSYQFPAGAATNNAYMGSATQTAASTSAVWSNSPIIGGIGTTGVGSSDASGVIFDYSTGTSAKYCILPSNFYMGPGDSLSMKIYGDINGVPTAYISYSFTTITES